LVYVSAAMQATNNESSRVNFAMMTAGYLRDTQDCKAAMRLRGSI
jgi:hypothetical protein